MALSEDEFPGFVERLEEAARRDPRSYRLRVGLLAALGYGFILLVLFFSIGLIGLVIALMVCTGRMQSMEIRILLALGVFVFAILRSLWVTFDKPDGIPLQRAEAGPLFDTVDRLTDRLGAPRFHHVLLTDDFNAAVAQRPRLGIFGWHENYLLVGLPLMQALSPAQFEGVLAHELGHLRGGHGRFGAWIYRVNASWSRLLQQVSRRGATGLLLKSFFRWYAPYFHAYSFALRRMDEYEADRCAVELVGGPAYAQALCLMPAHAEFIANTYWQEIYGRHREISEPAALRPFHDLARSFRSAAAGDAEEAGRLSRDTAEKALSLALKEKTGFDDTHPSLSDRLRALSVLPDLPEPVEISAAEALFGAHLPDLTERMDARWRAQITPKWRVLHAAAVEERRELARLNERAANGERLAPEDALRRASITEEHVGEAAAFPLYQELMDREDAAGHVAADQARFGVGRLLLQKDDPKGVALIEIVLARQGDAVLPGLQVLHEYYRRMGDVEAAERILQRARGRVAEDQHASEERSEVGGRDVRFLPHGLSEAERAEIVAQLAKFPRLNRAYLVRKEVRYRTDRPLYVLGVDLYTPPFRICADDEFTKLQSGIARDVSFPGEALVIALRDNALRARLRRVPGAEIYSRRK